MIIATVTTCPQRWPLYRHFRRQFLSLGLPVPLRTFQTPECPGDPRVNANLNARAALAFGNRHLPNGDEAWMLYLEDDVTLNSELPEILASLLQIGRAHQVDCWYLCNRKNPVREQLRMDPLVINDLAHPADGVHALLLPKRHLQRFLDADWSFYADQAILGTLSAMGAKTWQVVKPVLVEHVGEYSTFDPASRRKLEVNYEITSNSNPSA